MVYFQELLLDERRTLEEINTDSLSFRVSMPGTVSKVQKGKFERLSRVKWTRKFDIKLKTKNKNYSFDMIWIILTTAMVILPLSIFQTAEYFKSVSNSSKIVRNIDLYTKAVDFWNNNLLMKYSLLSTILWNGTRNINSTTTNSVDVFLAASKRMTERSISDLVAIKYMELGTNFKSTLKNLLVNSSACEVSKKQGKIIQGCGYGNLEFMNKNIIEYLKWTTKLAYNSYYVWQLQKESSNVVNETFSNKEFAAYINNSLHNGIEKDLYFSIMVPLSNNLKVVIDPAITVTDNGSTFEISGDRTEPSSYYLFFVVPLSIFTLTALIWLVYWRIVWTYTAFWKTALLLPVEIILKNPILTMYLREMESSTKSRISFF